MAEERLLTTFPVRSELERAEIVLERLGIECQRIDPTPPLFRVAVTALAVDRDARASLVSEAPDIVFSGWVEYRPSSRTMPEGPEPAGEPEPFGGAAIVVLLPCIADDTKIRIVAHLGGDLEPVFPYLNALMPGASYNPAGQTMTYMEGHRMISLSPRRIAVAKADDIVDAWLVLEGIRKKAGEAWAGRDHIEPCYETRRKPPALEIFRRLPGTNCGLCGETTCMAFAVRLWSGEAPLRLCKPAFEAGSERLRDALIEICAGLGVEVG
jgi:ArsR family metal-binding transcriptional regulator